MLRVTLATRGNVVVNVNALIYSNLGNRSRRCFHFGSLWQASRSALPPVSNNDDDEKAPRGARKRGSDAMFCSSLPSLCSSVSVHEKSKKERMPDYGSFAATSVLSAITPITPESPVATATATAAATEMNPLLHHFLETCITWGVPLSLSLLLPVLGAKMIAGPNKQGSGSIGSRRGKSDKKRLNPVAELYDDLYGSEEEQREKKKKPIEEIMDLVKDLRGREDEDEDEDKSRQITQKNRGIPPQRYITMHHWNQRLDSYQYSMTAATKSKAQAAAQYRATNLDRALSNAMWRSSKSLSSPQGDATDDVTPALKRKLMELEKDFLREGAKFSQSIQSIQTTLTRESIDEEMKRMGVYPYELDPNEKQGDKTSDNDTGNNDDSNNHDHNRDDNDIKHINKEATATKQTKSIMARFLSLPGNSIKKTKIGGDDKKKKDDRVGTASTSTALLEDLNNAQRKLMELELKFIKDVVSIMGAERATGIRVALLGDIAARGSGGLLTQLQERPLSVIFDAIYNTNNPKDNGKEDDSIGISNADNNKNNNNDNSQSVSSSPLSSPCVVVDSSQNHRHCRDRGGRLFVARFSGDTTASQVTKLREEITAITRSSGSADEALVILKSGGGTVSGYGLAAGQLQRLKHHGMKLTIVVEEVAASGGYMMCCVGDKIVGSPFAAFGSIGVITGIPNFFNRLQREGVEFHTVTAGKYKRTITPFNEVTTEDYEKTKEDLEDIHTMFRDFIAENRPQLADDMEDIATGEVWFGTDALAKGLCDEIKTADDVLLEYVDKGWDVFEVEYKKPRGISSLAQRFGVEGGEEGGIVDRTVRWFVRMLASELKSFITTESHGALTRYQHEPEKNQQIERQQQKYAAYYDGADRIWTGRTVPGCNK